MDTKKLFSILMVIGSLLFLFGLFQMIANQPKKFNPSESEQTILGRDDLGNYLNLQEENDKRKEKRDSATTFMIIGGIITLLSGIIIISSKQESTSDSGFYSATQNENHPEYHYCTNCGARIKYGSQCNNCNTN